MNDRCRVSEETDAYLNAQADREELQEAFADEIEAHAKELAAEAIMDSEQLSSVFENNQLGLACDLARLMRSLKQANAEFSELPLKGNWGLAGFLQSANALEKTLLAYVNDDDMQDRAAQEVLPE